MLSHSRRQTGFTWAEVASFRRRWPEVPLIIKGIMVGEDAEKCVELGVAGI